MGQNWDGQPIFQNKDGPRIFLIWEFFQGLNWKTSATSINWRGELQELKGIFAVEGENESTSSSEVIDSINLSQLHSLRLKSLPELINVCYKTHFTSQQRRHEIILEDNINIPNTFFIREVFYYIGLIILIC